MAKLSDIFGRRGSEPDAPPRHASGNGNGNTGRYVSTENFSDAGARMGEENEALRNLLSDTGRKIGELDELKDAFDKIVAPFNSTLRALELEKSQTLGLSGMLAESRASYDTLRTEFYQIERKATALESESEKLREDLELARESNRGLESTRIELLDGISARAVQIAELERNWRRRPRSAVRSARRAAPRRTSSTRPRSASSNWKANSPPRAKSWRCLRTKSVRCRSASTRRSTRPPASPAA